MKITKAQKRSELVKEWLLAVYGNNEKYYFNTIWTGIPDGDGFKTVMDDIKYGFYDDDLDEMLDMYRQIKAIYAKHGWYFGNDCEVIFDECEALYIINDKYNIPDRIYKEKYE